MYLPIFVSYTKCHLPGVSVSCSGDLEHIEKKVVSMVAILWNIWA